MDFSIMGLAYISIIICFAVQRKNFLVNMLLLSVVADIFLDVGYIIAIDDKTLNFCELPRHILLICCVITFIKKNYTLSTSWIRLMICCLIPIILLILFPSDANVANFDVTWDQILMDGEKPVHPKIDGYVIAQTRVFITSTFVLLYVYNSFRRQDYYVYIFKLSKLIKIFLGFGFLELIFKNYFKLSNLWSEAMESLWGKDSDIYLSELNRGNFYDLKLFTQEPSHWAYSLFVCAIVLFSTNIIKGKNNGISMSLLSAILLMILSLSFSSLLFLIGLFAIILIYRWNIQKPKSRSFEIKIVLFSFIVLLMGLSSFLLLFPDNLFASRLLFIIDNSTYLFGMDENKLVFSIENGPNLSVIIRILSIMYTLIISSFRPIFGYGLGSITCHGSSAILISGIGYLGLYAWVRFIFYSIPLNRIKISKSRNYLYAIIIYLIINLFNSLSLRPFYDLTLLVVVVSFVHIFSPKQSLSNYCNIFK